MITQAYISGNFKANHFVSGVTSSNEFFPIFIADVPWYKRKSNNGEPYFERIGNNVRMYRKPKNLSDQKYGSYNRYIDLFDLLKGKGEPVTFEFSSDNVRQVLTVMKGYIADKNDKILLLLATSETNVYKENVDRHTGIETETTDYSKLKLFISNELYTNPVYSNLLRKLEKNYFQYCYENNVDVVSTTSENIEKSVFSNPFKLDFSNFTEFQAHLESGIGNLLFETHEVPNSQSLTEDIIRQELENAFEMHMT